MASLAVGNRKTSAPDVRLGIVNSGNKQMNARQSKVWERPVGQTVEATWAINGLLHFFGHVVQSADDSVCFGASGIRSKHQRSIGNAFVYSGCHSLRSRQNRPR